MTISARITAVAEHDGCIALLLEPYRASDGIPARYYHLLITHGTRIPLVGQRVTSHHAGHCIVEGGGGERIVYARQGAFLREQVE